MLHIGHDQTAIGTSEFPAKPVFVTPRSHTLRHLMSRYQGKPFLRFLDSYVLDAIGQLSDDQRRGLEGLQPMLARSLSLDGTWQEIVSAAMQFPESMPESIRRLWRGYLDAARAAQAPVDPNRFVAEFIGANFPDIAPPSRDIH